MAIELIQNNLRPLNVVLSDIISGFVYSAIVPWILWIVDSQIIIASISESIRIGQSVFPL